MASTQPLTKKSNLSDNHSTANIKSAGNDQTNAKNSQTNSQNNYAQNGPISNNSEKGYHPKPNRYGKNNRNYNNNRRTNPNKRNNQKNDRDERDTRNNKERIISDENNHTDTDNDDCQNNNGIMCTKILQVQNKRYYFDIKEHDYGRFLKLAETSQTGRKSRLVVPMYMVPDMEKTFSTFIQKMDSLPDFIRNEKGGSGDNNNTNGTSPAVEHCADMLERGKRRYYFNLKENSRGRYLRVKAIGDIPQSLPGRRRRASHEYNYNGKSQRNNSGSYDQPRAIILPSSGIVPFRNILAKLVTEYGVDETTDHVAITDKNIEKNGTANDRLPTAGRFSCKQFRKVIFLDAGENSRGTFARITEQQKNYRESLTVPSLHFTAIGEWFMKAASLLTDEENISNNLSRMAIINGRRESTENEGESEHGNANFRREDASDSE